MAESRYLNSEESNLDAELIAILNGSDKEMNVNENSIPGEVISLLVNEGVPAIPHHASFTSPLDQPEAFELLSSLVDDGTKRIPQHTSSVTSTADSQTEEALEAISFLIDNDEIEATSDYNTSSTNSLIDPQVEQTFEYKINEHYQFSYDDDMQVEEGTHLVKRGTNFFTLEGVAVKAQIFDKKFGITSTGTIYRTLKPQNLSEELAGQRHKPKITIVKFDKDQKIYRFVDNGHKVKKCYLSKMVTVDGKNFVDNREVRIEEEKKSSISKTIRKAKSNKPKFHLREIPEYRHHTNFFKDDTTKTRRRQPAITLKPTN